MAQSIARDVSLEDDADALSRAWAEVWAEPERGRARLQGLLSAARARGEHRLSTLSAAWEAIHLVTFWSFEPGLDTRFDALAVEVRQAGWPRAQALMDAASALRTVRTRLDMEPALEQLLRLGPAEQDPRPPVERFWTEASACILQAEIGSFDAALRAGLVADRLADGCGLDWCVSMAQQGLAFTFLSVGDVEGAAAVLPRGIAARERMGGWQRTVHMRYNLLLTQVLSGQLNAAEAVIDAHPGLLGQEIMRGNPFLRCLAAYLRSLQGRHDEALALLALDAHPPEAPTDVPALAANRAWMTASVWHRAGQSERAHLHLQGFLAHSAAKGWPTSPLNATQLMRTLSEVREAMGDMRGALDALRRSQAACFQWVASSVRIRLQALHLQHPSDEADAERLERRLDALSRASAPRAAEIAPAAGPRNRFLAHVTHEMRNPLNGVIGMTALLALSDLNERQRRYVEVVESSAQMLLALCNDTLDLAKIEAGKFDLNPQPTELDTLLREAVRIYEHQVHSRMVSLQLDLDPALPRHLWVDRLRLQQVVMNLLGNAAKFTRQGSITVAARWSPPGEGDQGRLRVAVTDTGPGLDASQLARLFKEFSQADAGVAERHGGSGLGLALCRSLVELMGGQIDVDSEPGKGSSFWFELPLRAASAPAPSPVGP